ALEINDFVVLNDRQRHAGNTELLALLFERLLDRGNRARVIRGRRGGWLLGWYNRDRKGQTEYERNKASQVFHGVDTRLVGKCFRQDSRICRMNLVNPEILKNPV